MASSPARTATGRARRTTMCPAARRAWYRSPAPFSAAPEVLSKPLVARTKIDVSGLTSAEIDALVNESASESHSLYAVDAELMDELRPDLVITQDLCEVCAVSSGDLATACPIGTEVFSMNPRSFDDVVESVITLAARLGVRERGVDVAETMHGKVDAVRRAVVGRDRPRVFVAEW